jgi:hypothetical protein
MESTIIQGYIIKNIPYNQGMPLFRNKGLQALSFKDLMHDVVEAHESKDYEKRDFLLKNYKDTSTACPHYNNTFGIIHDFELLLNINENTPLINRALSLTKKEYNKLKKENKDYFLSRDDLIIERGLSEQQALESKGWFLLSGRNKELHTNFVKIRYSLSPKGSKLMNIYLPDDQENPEIRAWFLWDLDDRSDAIAGDSLNYYTRLFGVPQKNLEKLLI